ncbi:alpha/beta fold hydrolase [Halomonas sp. WWR20]
MTTLLTIIAILVMLVVLAGTGLAVFTAHVARKVEAAVPASGQYMDVEGARLHFVEKGSGPPIVLIHGLGGQLHHSTYALFAQLSDGFHLLAVDRPGSGYSTRHADASARPLEQARILHDFIQARRLDRPLVVGHSLGGAIALALALEYPQSVGGLALIAPLTHTQQEVPQAFKGLAIESAFKRRLIAWTLATPMSIRKSREMLGWVFAPQLPPEDFGTRGGGLLSLRPQSFYSTSLDLVSIHTHLPGMQERYTELTVPIGVLYGTEDHILDYQRNGCAMVQKVPDLDLELIDGLGHMIPITHPNQAASFIQRMAQKVFGERRRDF